MTRTTDTTTMTDQDLVTAASKGDQSAFDELHRRHAPLAWRLALAITGRPEDAATAVAEGTGTTFTAARSGRPQAAHPVALAAATRNAALDLRRGQDTISAPVAADDADPILAAAFGALPERWRSVLWLRDAEGLDADRAASIVELTPEAVDQLAVRARRGLRERYLRAHVATSPKRDCTRASNRLGALQDGTLNASDAANLERHLANCAGCSQRRTALAAMPSALPALAVAVPADLHDKARATWTAAVASTTSTGLSPRTEKILAGASAFAAAVGVLGAALFGTGGDGDPVASPLAPLVSDIDPPRPIDLAALALPVIDDPVPVRGSLPLTTSSPGMRSTGGTAGASVPGAGGEIAAPAPGSPGELAAESPAPDGDDPGNLDVGPIGVDLTPDEGEETLTVDAPEQLDPVVDPVVDAGNTVAEPAVEAGDPVLETTETITTGINDVISGIGL